MLATGVVSLLAKEWTLSAPVQPEAGNNCVTLYLQTCKLWKRKVHFHLHCEVLCIFQPPAICIFISSHHRDVLSVAIPPPFYIEPFGMPICIVSGVGGRKLSSEAQRNQQATPTVRTVRRHRCRTCLDIIRFHISL